MADCSDLAKLMYQLARHHARTPGIDNLSKLSTTMNEVHGLEFTGEELGALLTEASVSRAKEISEVAKQFPKLMREAKGNKKATETIQKLKDIIDQINTTNEPGKLPTKPRRSPSEARDAYNKEIAELRKELHNLAPNQAARIKNKLREMQDKLDRNDFADPIPADKSPATKEITLLKEQQRDLQRKVRLRVENTRPKNLGVLLKEGGLAYKMYMAGRDLSAVGVQAGFATTARPELTFAATPALQNALKTEEGAQQARRDIEERPNYVWYRVGKTKLALGDWDGPVSAQDEQYMGSLARHMAQTVKGEKPGLGKVIKPFAQLTHSTGRANTVFLNTLRANWFDYISENIFNGEMTGERAEYTNKLVNTLTGHGGLGPIEQWAEGLNSFFFSPRLMSSAIQQGFVLLPKAVVGEVLNTAGVKNEILGGKELRRFVAKTYGRYISTGVSLLALAAASGMDIEVDPRSGGFGTISMPGGWGLNVFGNVRPAMVLLSQVAPFVGGVKDGRTGKIRPITGKNVSAYDRPTARVTKFLRSKEAPAASLLHNLLERTDYSGRDTTYAAIVNNAIIPIDVKNVAESISKSQNIGYAAAAGVVRWFGVPLNHYEVVTPKSKKRSGPGY